MVKGTLESLSSRILVSLATPFALHLEISGSSEKNSEISYFAISDQCICFHAGYKKLSLTWRDWDTKWLRSARHRNVKTEMRKKYGKKIFSGSIVMPGSSLTIQLTPTYGFGTLLTCFGSNPRSIRLLLGNAVLLVWRCIPYWR